VALKRTLIEVAVPLEAINRASLAEKNRKVGKPQNLQKWWARKPITAARAMLLAQLITDPASEPEKFPTAEAVEAERERLHGLIKRAVEWQEVVQPTAALQGTIAELLPNVTVCDPFVGGGSIPLAAQQFGLSTHSSDLNPVAVLLSKALVEIPSRFPGRNPVHTRNQDSQLTSWPGATGLAADVEAYGEWMLNEAKSRIGMHYPKIDGMQVLAWLWARSVQCPNPGCRIRLPLVSKWWLAKKKGKEAYLVPHVEEDPQEPSRKVFRFSIGHDPKLYPDTGLMSGRTGTHCLGCGAAVSVDYVRNQGKTVGLTPIPIAIVAEGAGRVYLPPTEEHIEAAVVHHPPTSVSGEIAENPRWFSPPMYGMTEFADLFTDRQLLAMVTFSDLVVDVREQILRDALDTGMPRGERLAAGGSEAEAYADAVAIYLAISVCRLANWSNNQCSWEANGEVSQQLYTGQAMGMAWDISEANVLGEGNSGSFLACVKSIAGPLTLSQPRGTHRIDLADVRDAQINGYVIATDPPYFDNIGYSDLSDFFYVWQRRMLSGILPAISTTMLVPKATELVANTYRSGGAEAAAEEFVAGFEQVFEKFREQASRDFPLVVYYASKQAETNALAGANSRWATILQAMVNAEWQIVRTWPIRTENVSRRVAIGNNSISTSTVLVLRPRPADAPAADLQSFITKLREELHSALPELQAAGIAPVDLPQAAIGPGMSVFTRYRTVFGAEGEPMTVQTALALINEIVDRVYSEQEGDFDSTTRFGIAWYRQFGYKAGKFSDADNLAQARDTSVAMMERAGILQSRAGHVQLIRPEDLDIAYDPVADPYTSDWEVFHHIVRLLESDGIGPTGLFLRSALTRPDVAVDTDRILELAHLLFRIAETNGWTKDALNFNTLVTSWPEIFEIAREKSTSAVGTQSGFNFDEGDD
jgi:putative DNA methylase